MTIDLTLGFRQKPSDLRETLARLGFKLDRVFPKEDIHDVTMECYEFYDPTRSNRSVLFTYHDGTYPDHCEGWNNIVEDPNLIVASGSLITAMGRNTFDESKQQDVGRFLRDHYDAVLYDPQAGKSVTD